MADLHAAVCRLNAQESLPACNSPGRLVDYGEVERVFTRLDIFDPSLEGLSVLGRHFTKIAEALGGVGNSRDLEEPVTVARRIDGFEPRVTRPSIGCRAGRGRGCQSEKSADTCALSFGP